MPKETRTGHLDLSGGAGRWAFVIAAGIFRYHSSPIAEPFPTALWGYQKEVLHFSDPTPSALFGPRGSKA
jgi:hypothetical protein